MSSILTNYGAMVALQNLQATQRSLAVRRSLGGSGLTQDRLLRVEGRASVDLLMPQAPLDPRNRRIAVTILRSDVEQQMRAAR